MILGHDRLLLNKFVKTTAIDSLYLLVTHIYIMFYSPYLESLGWSEIGKGWFFFIYGITAMVMSPVIGTVADRVGRYRVIVFGLIVEVISLAGYALFTDPIILFCLRVLSAIAYTSVTLTALSRINDIVKDNKTRSKVNGIYLSLTSIAALVAPLIGGFIADYYGYQQIFIVAFLGMVGLLAIIFFFDKLFFDKKTYKGRELKKCTRRDFNPLADIKDMLAIKEMRALSVLGVMSNFTAPFIVLVLPFVIMENMGLGNIHLSIIITVVGVAHAFQYFFGYIADKQGKGKSMVVGLTILAAGFIGLFFVQSYEMLLVLVLLKAAGSGLWNIAAWSYMSDIGEKHKIEGKILGSYMSLTKIATSLSYIISGVLLTMLGTGIFFIYGGIILVALAIVGKTFMK